MKKAREVWRLKIEGAKAEKISSDLSISSSLINDIFKYTVAEHYTPLIKKPSYYDEQLLFKHKISLEKKKLQKITKSIKYKKNIFYIMLQITAVIIIALIVL